MLNNFISFWESLYNRDITLKTKLNLLFAIPEIYFRIIKIFKQMIQEIFLDIFHKNEDCLILNQFYIFCINIITHEIFQLKKSLRIIFEFYIEHILSFSKCKIDLVNKFKNFFKIKFHLELKSNSLNDLVFEIQECLFVELNQFGISFSQILEFLAY